MLKIKKVFLLEFILLLVIVLLVLFFFCFKDDKNHINFTENITPEQKVRINELFLENNIDFPNKSFLVTDFRLMETGQELVRYKIYYKEFPVFAGEPEIDFDQKTNKVINLDSVFSLKSYLDMFNKINISDENLVAKISEQKAVETAESIITLKSSIKDLSSSKLKAMLGIRDMGNQEKSNFILTWRVVPVGLPVGNVPEVYINALTGIVEEEHFGDL